MPGLARQGTPGPEPACADSGFDCELQGRFEAVRDYLEDRPGTSGVVVRDLRTGAEWHNEHARDLTWTASTIKLAMVVDLFTRNRSGEITLSTEDRTLIHAMLHSSDDRAADTLWYRYAGRDHQEFNDNFPDYGLTSLVPQKGFSDYFPYWGFQKCTAEDLDRLMTFVLTELPGDERDLIVAEMRSVGAEQQWGVWGAGPDARPGTKDGWSEEVDGWVMNTVGFVGPGERYTLTVMNALHGEAGYTAGRATVTAVARLLFAGYFPA
ncbi:tat pathway signal sequence [Actinophytocola xanthii]|uniref:Tat pathway signal sequence n=1 Tax=Actinophytocola xanthii TaxID=1912961 RepID=A0A1Q8CRJ0_9PSEU|nr:tat pathway signal sequence [Actinophytocola xanthii]